MGFDVTILGSGAATPTTRRNPTSQLINFNEKFFLLDCGEGTQLQLRKFKTKFQRINHIFISHLHGDHYFGIFGLISTFQLLGRSQDLHIYAPADLKNLIDLNLGISHSSLRFDIIFHPTQSKEKELLYNQKKLKIFSFPLEHRIPTTGFLIEEQKGHKNIIKEKIDLYHISIEEIKEIKEGKDLKRGNKIISNDSLTHPEEALRCYAYCTDTRPNDHYPSLIQNATTLYHEATFTKEHQLRAQETFHTTAQQAGEIAKNINAKKLILGHFSARYDNANESINEAKSIFTPTFPAEDGENFSII